MTPADIIETGPTHRPAGPAPRRKRSGAQHKAKSMSRSPGRTAARRKAARAQPGSAWNRLRHKLSQGANQAKADAGVGLATLGAIYLGSTLVALVFIGVDWLGGTSLMRGPDWVLPVKLTTLAATLLWALAPAATLSWVLEAPRAPAIRPPLSLPKRVRPIVSALALATFRRKIPAANPLQIR